MKLTVLVWPQTFVCSSALGNRLRNHCVCSVHRPLYLFRQVCSRISNCNLQADHTNGKYSD
ncbi:hypothetical protein PF005_g20912 [Phytophthora fragariae]|uniref:Uncharacterized protein n=1 Tax=Phytophthora fragariae TaxID=53985 RepID=A0A6A3WJV6_9STRA|nr:hypothetical protein PF005_g20912 [Phytophthora fragariae]KAE9263502.1 hypothetical protein PF001_g31649 [Phytophthora fragariae]